MKARLNRSFISQISGQVKTTIIWDSDLKGFGIRIYPNGAKSWLVDFTINRKRSRRIIGDYDRVTPEAARNHAKKLLSEAALNVNPFEKDDEARKQLNLRDFAIEYMVRHGNLKKSSRDDGSRLKTDILPKMGCKRLSDIKRQDVALLHGFVGKRSIYQANRALALLSKMFNLATLWGYLPEGHQNPCRGIEKFKEESRERFLNTEEMGRLLETVRKHRNPYIRAIILLDILTGLRLGEMLALKWSDIDEENKQIVLHRTKQGRKHYVPLTDDAMKIIWDIPELHGNPYLFPGHKKGSHLTDIKRPWTEIRTEAGLMDIHYHDLRRSLGSWLIQDGASLALVGKILGHSQASTTQIYARFLKDSGRHELEKHSIRIASVEKKD